MKLLVCYATTDGQTRKIARFVADRIVDGGHSVELLNAEDGAGLELGRFRAAVLAGSLHLGGYQKALAGFVREHAVALNAMPTLFLPVSLSAAGKDEDDWRGLRDCTTRFLGETGWQPGKVEHVAGAFRFTEYDFFRAWAMKRIAAQKGEEVDPGQDKEYTDWPSLSALIDDWIGDLAV